MPNTAWRVARREIARPLGLVEFVTTTNIPSGAKTITSTSLADRFQQNDYFIGWFATVVLDDDGGTPANGLGTSTLRVTDYAGGTTGVVTYGGVQLSAEDEAVDVDLYRFHPDDIQRAYNRARQVLFPTVAIVKDVTTLVSGQRQHTYTIPVAARMIDSVWMGNRYSADSLAENLFTDGGFEYGLAPRR